MNLNSLQDAGFSFIVGSRISKAPYDLAEHFQRHGDYFTDGQILESSRVMDRRAARTRRIVDQTPSTRRYHRRPSNSSSRWGAKVTKARGTTQVGRLRCAWRAGHAQREQAGYSSWPGHRTSDLTRATSAVQLW